MYKTCSFQVGFKIFQLLLVESRLCQYYVFQILAMGEITGVEWFSRIE
jgi:hypothetical protein